jgi:hypothetical protein
MRVEEWAQHLQFADPPPALRERILESARRRPRARPIFALAACAAAIAGMAALHEFVEARCHRSISEILQVRPAAARPKPASGRPAPTPRSFGTRLVPAAPPAKKELWENEP